MHLHTFRTALAAVVGLALLAPAAHAAPDLLYTFEDLAPDAFVTEYGQVQFKPKADVGFNPDPAEYTDIFPSGRRFTSCDRTMIARSPGLRGDRRLVPTCRNNPKRRASGSSAAGFESAEPAMFASFARTRTRVSLRLRPSPCVDEPPRNGFTGTPCDLSSALLAFNAQDELVATALGGPRAETLSITRPTDDIAYVELGHDNGGHPSYDQIGVDDLGFDAPDTPGTPDFTLIGADIAKPVGGTYDVPIRLRRINLSSGAVQLSHLALPNGIESVTFDPNPSTGEVVTARVKIASNAPLNKPLQITLVAQPQSASAGSQQRTATLSVTPKVPFEISVPGGAIKPSSCGTTKARVSLVPSAGYEGPPVAVSLAVPAGYTVSPASFEAAPQGITTREIVIMAPPRAFVDRKPGQILDIVAKAQGEVPQFTPVAIEPAPPRIDSVTFPGSARNGFLNLPAGSVHVQGAGFCPGDEIVFGGEVPVAGSPGPAGTSLAGPVPNGAGPGPIKVKTPDGTVAGTGTGVQTFRSTWGFAFPNAGDFVSGELTTNDVLGGFVDSHVTVDVCRGLTFGILDCEVRVPHPWALRLIGKDFGGLCYGFAAASARTVLGLPVSGMARTPLPYALGGPTGPLVDVLRHQHAMQWSEQAQNARVLEPSMSKFVDRVSTMLKDGGVPIISLRAAGGGHAVVAYRARDLGGERWSIDLYDPNQPHAAGHADTPPNSTVEVDGQRWTFRGLTQPNGQPWTGDADSIKVSSASKIPRWGEGSILVNALIPFGDDGASVSDDKGRPIDQVDGAEVIPTLDASGGPTLYRLTSDRGWRVSGGGAFVGDGWSAVIEPQGARSAQAKSTALIDPKSHSVEATGGRARLTVSTDHGKGARTAVVDGSGGTSVSFSRNDGEVMVEGRGTATVSLGASGPKSAPTSVRLRVALGSGVTRIKPSSWTKRGSVTVTVRRGGKQRRVVAKAQRLPVRLGKPSVTTGRGTAVVKVAVGALAPVDGQVSVAARALRGGRPVGRAVSTELGRKGGTATLTLRGLPRGALSIRVFATAVGTVKGAALSGQQTKNARATVR